MNPVKYSVYKNKKISIDLLGNEFVADRWFY